MKLTLLWAAIAVLLVAMSSCSSPPKGACITPFGCSPNTTAAKCRLIFGENVTFYKGKTCADLGYDSA